MATTKPDGWAPAKKITCSGCGMLLYQRGLIVPDVETSVVSMSGDHEQITVVMRAVRWHTRKDCENPTEFGATVVYEKET